MNHLHQWQAITYIYDREVGWACKICGLTAQLQPEKNMSIRNDPKQSIIPTCNDSQQGFNF